MQLRDKSGIMCDYCGAVYKDDFIYYCFDFKSVQVNGDVRPSLDAILSEKCNISLDVCVSCYDRITAVVVGNYNKIMSPARKNRIVVTCELTGNQLSGSYVYYYCEVAKVTVRISQQPYTCIKCRNQTAEHAIKCAKCEGSVVRIASVRPDYRNLEIVLCDDAFQLFLKKAEQVRQNVGDWSTNS